MCCKAEIDYFYHAIKCEESNNETYNQDEARKNAQKVLSEIKSEWGKLADLIRERLLNSSSLVDKNQNAHD